MNVYDSERMADGLAAAGITPVDSAEAADLIVLNTCHIREKAAEKVFSELGRMRKSQRLEGRPAMIAVAGCVAQAEGAVIAKRAPGVDIVVGPQSYHRLPELIARARSSRATIVEAEFPAAEKFEQLARRTNRNQPTAFLTIQEGCDKFCTFCVVPYTRGAEFSRPVAAILDEAKRLVDQGVREITLLGQNVNAFHGEDAAGQPVTLAKLMDELSDLPGLARLRYTTSHPQDMDDSLFAAHLQNPKVMPCLHLPVQSGSDRILKAMNRRHTVAHYLEIIAKARAARPDMAISTDLIVGFPGETDADAEATEALVRQIEFSQAYSFKYSPRPGTPAADRTDQVPEAVKTERLVRLQALLEDQRLAFNRACIGRTLPALD